MPRYKTKCRCFKPHYKLAGFTYSEWLKWCAWLREHNLLPR